MSELRDSQATKDSTAKKSAGPAGNLSENFAKNYKRGDLFYEGKAKNLYQVLDHPELVWQEFRNSLTAFNAQKKGEFAGKGSINRDITSIIFRYLGRYLKTHWIKDIGETDMLTQRLSMLKLEVVIRNVLAGSTAKKLGLDEGTALAQPLVEFYYKDDALADPFVSDDQALLLKTVKNQGELDELKRLGLLVNHHLAEIFSQIGIQLIDFKIEFGQDEKGEIFLADEISPDSCRLWDQKTKEKLDKDRFRRDLGNVQESYELVRNKIIEHWGSKV
jgi:phosphoribosylaminoimidazole-succinocarboxamide synthase